MLLMRFDKTVWWAVGMAVVTVSICEAQEKGKKPAVREAKAAKPRTAVTGKTELPSAKPAEVKALLEGKDGYVYIDVRTEGEFAKGHVPNSLNIPVLFLNKSAGRREPNESFVSVVIAHVPKDAKVIVGCRSGARSARAQKIMVAAGFENVTNMVGGFIGKRDSKGEVVVAGWSKLGYPSETGDGGAKSYKKLKEKPRP